MHNELWIFIQKLCKVQRYREKPDSDTASRAGDVLGSGDSDQDRLPRGDPWSAGGRCRESPAASLGQPPWNLEFSRVFKNVDHLKNLY